MAELLQRPVGGLLIAIAISWLLVPCAVSQPAKYLPIDTLEDAAALYDTAVSRCDEAMLVEAGDALLRLKAALGADSEGLGWQYANLLPKIDYMLGWYYYRRTEHDGAAGLVDSALHFFDIVDSLTTSENGELPAYAAYMAGEIRLSRAVAGKFSALCSGSLDSTRVARLSEKMEEARSLFEAASIELTGQAAGTAAATKAEDAKYEMARLQRAFGNLDSANSYFMDNIDYLSAGRGGDDVGEYNRYCDALMKLERVLLSTADLDLADLPTLYANLQYVDRPLRIGSISLAQGQSTEAEESFSLAASLVDTIVNPADSSDSSFLPHIPEADYFRGYAMLDSAVGEDLLDNVVISALREARISFEALEDKVDSAGFNGSPRLRRLVTRARDMYELLGVAEGDTIPDTNLANLSREEVKFLIRITASLSGGPRSRCANELRKYFNLYDLPQLRGTERRKPDGASGAEPCAVATVDTMSRNEALFLNGLVICLQAEAKEMPYGTAADTLAEVKGDYEGEALYLRAYALYKADEYETADSLLKELVAKRHSVRALYYYGINLRDWKILSEGDSALLSAVMQKVMTVTDTSVAPPGYTNIWGSAVIMVNDLAAFFQSNADSVLRKHFGTDSVSCPDVLSIDSSGAFPDTILYQSLAEKQLIRSEFERESRREYSIYGLPKLWLLPTSRSCSRGSTLGLTEAIIPDSVHVERVWRGLVRFFDHDGNVLKLDQCLAKLTKDGSTLKCRFLDTASTYLVDSTIDTRESIKVEAAKSDFYRTFLKLGSEELGDQRFDVTLAHTVRYSPTDESVDERPFEYAQRPDTSYGFNLVTHPVTLEPPSQLTSDFENDRDLRDYCYDQTKNRWLAVSSRLDHALLSYTDEHDIDTIAIDRSVSLSSAEGIAVDSLGNLFIADWGNHRVVVLDKNQQLRFTFGSFGENRETNIGASARLVFPNRIAIERDETGLSPPRETHLLVSDRLGVHKFDSQGRYLDSPVRAMIDVEAGSCYEITLDGYGPGSSLRIHSLNTDPPRTFRAEQQ